MTRLIALAAALGLTGCGGSHKLIELPPEPIAYVDTLPSERPKQRKTNQTSRLLEVSVGGEIGSAFSLRRWTGELHEAVNRTRFDDVVNSAWFEHRITVGNMTAEDVARGSTTMGPDTSRTLLIVSGITAGISPKFWVRDATGTRFIVKFDPRGNLHLASAAGVISNRLLHAAGYYVPEDFIVVFDSTRLELDPEATIEIFGKERLMTTEDVYDILALTDKLPDGKFLAIASKFVPGRPLDSFHFSGVRKDDPNDYYYHQHRRELRGLYVISSWMNHVDMRYENTLDVFIDPPGYVRHYLMDLAATLGSGTIRSHNPREGKEYNFDFWPSVARVFSAGFYQAGWEDAEFTQYHPSIGWLRGSEFDPASWRPNWPNAAFRMVRPADGYWGAKIVASFSDEQIRAAVERGQLPSEEPVEILTRILRIRRDKIIDYWYAQVVPVENVDASFTGSGRETLVVSFDDLGLGAGLWEAADVEYYWIFEDEYLNVTVGSSQLATPGARQRLEIRSSRFGDDAPAVGESQASARLRIDVKRGGKLLGRPATILLRWEGPNKGYAVAGLLH